MVKCTTCGMEISDPASALKIEYDNTLYYFCCEHCRDAFVKEPEKYIHGTHEHHHHGHSHGGQSCC